MAGAFRDAQGDTFLGVVTAPDPITACIVSFVSVDGNPIVSEGDIRPAGTPGAFSGTALAGGNCLAGDIDRGGFATAGIFAAVHFSVDYNVAVAADCPTVAPDVHNVPCGGAIGVVPIPGESTIAGAIACGGVAVL